MEDTEGKGGRTLVVKVKAGSDLGDLKEELGKLIDELSGEDDEPEDGKPATDEPPMDEDDEDEGGDEPQTVGDALVEFVSDVTDAGLFSDQRHWALAEAMLERAREWVNVSLDSVEGWGGDTAVLESALFEAWGMCAAAQHAVARRRDFAATSACVAAKCSA